MPRLFDVPNQAKRLSPCISKINTMYEVYEFWRGISYTTAEVRREECYDIEDNASTVTFSRSFTKLA